MSGGGFEVSVDHVRGGATGFGVAGEMLGQAKSTLDGALSAQGECWGGDDSGKEFAKEYVPNSEKTKEAFASLTEALGAIKTALDETAATYEGADSINASGLGQQHG